MLKFKLDPKAFEALSEAEQTFYKKEGDVYQLQVDGAADKDKLNEFRQTNVELLKKTEAYKDVDLDKWQEFQELERKRQNAELIDKKDFDGLLEKNTAALRADYEAKLEALKQENDGLSGKYTSTVSKYEIEGATSKAFAAHKINPDFNTALMAEIRSTFSVDNGQVIAKDGDKILAGANGNLTIDEFIASKPESYKIPSNPGVGHGGGGHKPASTQTSVQRIAAGLKSVG